MFTFSPNASIANPNVSNATGVLPIVNGGTGSNVAQTTLIQVTANNANATVSIPAGYGIASWSLINTTANAVTGGIKIGTTSGGVEVLTSLAVGASAVIGNTTLLKYVFSLASDTTLYLQPLTAWNSAIVHFSFICYRIIP